MLKGVEKWGATSEKKHRNREIAGMKTVGGWEHMGSWFKAKIGTSPVTKYKRSKNVFFVSSIAISLGHVGTRLLELPAQSPIGSPRTLLCKAGVYGKCVSVLHSCFSQLGERDLSPLFLVGTKRVVSSVLASCWKSSTADFGKRWSKLDPNLCERRWNWACMLLFTFVLYSWFGSA